MSASDCHTYVSFWTRLDRNAEGKHRLKMRMPFPASKICEACALATRGHTSRQLTIADARHAF